MPNLNDEMSRLFFVLNPPVERNTSVSIQFIAATSNEGVSNIAREFAFTASRQIEGRVLLLDLNLSGEPQYDALSKEENRIRFGDVGEAARIMGATKGTHTRFSTTWMHNDQTPKSEQNIPLVTFHQLGDSELYVTRINTDMVKRYGRPRVNSSVEYWNSLSNAFQMIIIDSSPLSANYDGLAVCKYFDASVLVVSAERTRRPVATNLRDRILDNDGHIAGVIFNRRKMHIPRFIYKLL